MRVQAFRATPVVSRRVSVVVRASAVAKPVALPAMAADGSDKGTQPLALKVAEESARALVHRYLVMVQQNARAVGGPPVAGGGEAGWAHSVQWACNWACRGPYGGGTRGWWPGAHGPCGYGAPMGRAATILAAGSVSGRGAQRRTTADSPPPIPPGGPQGTASTLTRSEVRGGGKKPYAQKGTGNARRGSNVSPLFPGGGIIFGPKVRGLTGRGAGGCSTAAHCCGWGQAQERTSEGTRVAELPKG
jgi:hypothetical protein